jgi:peroxiredoxin
MRAKNVFTTMVATVLLLPSLALAVDLPKPGLAETNGAVTVGKPAPPLVGTDIKGQAVTAETFKGRPVLVDFSSIFCSSCQETIKEFVRLEKAYKSTDLALVVVTDGASSIKAMNNLFGQLGATYTVIRDEGSKLFEGYGVTLIPFQVVIDRQGIVRKIHNGFNADMENVFGLRELSGPGAAAQ